MSLTILFSFCRSILHVNVFSLHVIQVQQKLVMHQHLNKSFAFKEVDDGNFSVDETSIYAFCQIINTETCPDMCVRY